MDGNFRRIDIDILDKENSLTKEDLIPPVAAVSESQISAKAQQIRQTLAKGDYRGALNLALEDPPYGGDDRVKDIHLKSVIDILAVVKANDITPLVDGLPSEQQDNLVKYLYKGMGSNLGQSHGNGGVLLTWFEKTVDITGQGSIIRYLSDRRTV